MRLRKTRPASAAEAPRLARFRISAPERRNLVQLPRRQPLTDDPYHRARQNQAVDAVEHSAMSRHQRAESFTAAPRLYADSIKSPICPAIFAKPAVTSMRRHVDLHPAREDDSATSSDATTFAIAPSQVFFGLSAGAIGTRPSERPTKYASVSPAQIRHSVKRTSWRPDAFDFVDAHQIAERQRHEQQSRRADRDRRQDILQRPSRGQPNSHRAEQENQQAQPRSKVRRPRHREPANTPPLSVRVSTSPPRTARRIVPPAQTIVHLRKARSPTRSPRSKNSISARIATTAATAASSAGGPHHTSATTAGIRTTAVRMRRSIRRQPRTVIRPTPAAAWRLRIAARRPPAAPRAQSAVAPLALLEIDQRLEQPRARKIRPQRFGDVNFGVGDLPEQKIAHAHFAARADQQIGIGQSGGIEMIGDGLLVRAESRKSVRANVIEHGVERVGQLGAPAVIQRHHELHARIARRQAHRVGDVLAHRFGKLLRTVRSPADGCCSCESWAARASDIRAAAASGNRLPPAGGASFRAKTRRA